MQMLADITRPRPLKPTCPHCREIAERVQGLNFHIDNVVEDDEYVHYWGQPFVLVPKGQFCLLDDPRAST